MHNRQWACAQHIYGIDVCIMYLAAINKRYEYLVSNLAWSDCIYFYRVEKSLLTLPLNFLLQNQHMPLSLIDC